MISGLGIQQGVRVFWHRSMTRLCSLLRNSAEATNPCDDTLNTLKLQSRSSTENKIVWSFQENA